MMHANKLGCTPLHAAAMHGKDKAIEWMLDRGADPRACDSEGYCPMHYAAGEGHVEAIEMLIVFAFVLTFFFMSSVCAQYPLIA